MQEAANIPLEVMCHDLERKQASIVYQFQSIEILQVELAPISIAMLDVAAAAALVRVAVVELSIAIVVEAIAIAVELPISILF